MVVRKEHNQGFMRTAQIVNSDKFMDAHQTRRCSVAKGRHKGVMELKQKMKKRIITWIHVMLQLDYDYPSRITDSDIYQVCIISMT